MGKKLIVGVHTDEDIIKHKGPPVFTSQERYEMVRSIKWVDQVVEGAPYVTTLETLDEYGAEYCAHGDDLTMDADGNDTYRHVKEAGRYKEFKRTQGVSTTDIVGRMLLACKATPASGDKKQKLTKKFSRDGTLSPWTGVSKFLQTSNKISMFSNAKEASKDDIVIYVAGGFDMFHNGHLNFLKECRKLGTYLVVGLHEDEEVQRYRGQGNPILNVQERTLSVLACRYVDEVLIGAPYSVSNDIIDHFNVKFVCHGHANPPVPDVNFEDPYKIPKQRGIFKTVDSKTTLTTQVLIDRIVRNKEMFKRRNEKKVQKEADAYKGWMKSRGEDVKE